MPPRDTTSSGRGRQSCFGWVWRSGCVASWVSVSWSIGVSRNPVEIRDYNGTRDWTVEAVTQRYEAHSKRHGLAVMRYVNYFDRFAV